MSLEIKNGTLRYAEDAHKGITKVALVWTLTGRRQRESGQKPAGGGWCWRKWNGRLCHGAKHRLKHRTGSMAEYDCSLMSQLRLQG